MAQRVNECIGLFLSIKRGIAVISNHIDYLEPTHLEDVYAMVLVRRTVDRGAFCGPPHDDRGVVGLSLHPDVMDGKSKSWGHASETLEPAANCLTVMSLTAQGTRPVKAMMNAGDAVFDQGVEVLLIHSFKVLPGNLLHYGVIPTVSLSNVNIVYIGLDVCIGSPVA
jgi:hypothetical protein